jgi:hypothetical protein
LSALGFNVDGDKRGGGEVLVMEILDFCDSRVNEKASVGSGELGRGRVLESLLEIRDEDESVRPSSHDVGRMERRKDFTVRREDYCAS